ncbi:MAG: serine/threonine-protein kinase [Isosphaeraceae bacterium]
MIEGVIGIGSFGTVFRARDVTLERPVALKVLRPGARGGARLMLAEARAAASLRHPNLCAIFAVDESLGSPIIAMEYLPGKPLSTRIAQGPLEPSRAAAVLRQVASGMAFAHSRGVVHGDLKPENVMVDDQDNATILDFGLARRRISTASPDETVVEGPADVGENGGLFGTPSYLAPELVRGEAATEASDVFSCGLLAFEMLTGRKAFTGHTILEVLDRVRSVDHEALASEVPEPFSGLLRRMLNPEPALRDVSMEAVAEALSPAVRYS